MSPRWSPDRLDPLDYAAPGHDLPVLFADLDFNWHVNNVAMGRFFEHVRVMNHQESGANPMLWAADKKLVSVSVAIHYLAEAKLGDLHVRSRLARIGTSSFVEEQAAWQDGKPVALAEVTIVTVQDTGDGMVSTPLPDDVRQKLSEWLSPERDLGKT